MFISQKYSATLKYIKIYNNIVYTIIYYTDAHIQMTTNKTNININSLIVSFKNNLKFRNDSGVEFHNCAC